MQKFTDLYRSASLDDHQGKVPVLIGMSEKAPSELC